MYFVRSFFIIFLLWVTGVACVHTSYSGSDESQITDTEVQLILGMFAHHGEAFYKSEVKRTKELLEKDEKDFVARNDLASAYIKLKKYEEAEAEYFKNEKLQPGKYETASNLGVLYKKMGRYEDSSNSLKEAFKIKPEGHMGLADYYLRMVEWMELRKQLGENIEKDFLGRKYEPDHDGILVTDEEQPEKEYLITLVKNDYKFPDVYYVLGRHYLEENDYQLAIRCFYRAKSLDHPRMDIVSKWIDKTMEEMESLTQGGLKFDTHGIQEQIEDELKKSDEWLTEYQAFEESRIAAGEPVDFASMKSLVTKPSVYDAGGFTGVADKTTYELNAGLLSTGALVLLFIGVVTAIAIRMVSKSAAAT